MQILILPLTHDTTFFYFFFFFLLFYLFIYFTILFFLWCIIIIIIIFNLGNTTKPIPLQSLFLDPNQNFRLSITLKSPRNLFLRFQTLLLPTSSHYVHCPLLHRHRIPQEGPQDQRGALLVHYDPIVRPSWHVWPRHEDLWPNGWVGYPEIRGFLQCLFIGLQSFQVNCSMKFLKDSVFCWLRFHLGFWSSLTAQFIRPRRRLRFWNKWRRSGWW